MVGDPNFISGGIEQDHASEEGGMAWSIPTLEAWEVMEWGLRFNSTLTLENQLRRHCAQLRTFE
jgi:hypothetical protein